MTLGLGSWLPAGMVPALDGYDMYQRVPAGKKRPAAVVMPAGAAPGRTDPAAVDYHHQTQISCVDSPWLRVLPREVIPQWKALEGVDQMDEVPVALGCGRAPSLAAGGNDMASAVYNMPLLMPASSDQLGNILKNIRKHTH